MVLYALHSILNSTLTPNISTSVFIISSNGEVSINCIPTSNNLADVFTKPLAVTPFVHFQQLLGLY